MIYAHVLYVGRHRQQDFRTWSSNRSRWKRAPWRVGGWGAQVRPGAWDGLSEEEAAFSWVLKDELLGEGGIY